MRLYTFSNTHLSSTQFGLQSAHVTSQLSIKYWDDPDRHAQYIDWATFYTTIVMLDGGNQSSLTSILDTMSYTGNPYAWSYFRETECALNNCLTGIGIIIPERLYSIKLSDALGTTIPYNTSMNITEYDWELIQLLKSFQLVR
jgi:hypothetical protein